MLNSKTNTLNSKMVKHKYIKSGDSILFIVKSSHEKTKTNIELVRLTSADISYSSVLDFCYCPKNISKLHCCTGGHFLLMMIVYFE